MSFLRSVVAVLLAGAVGVACGGDDDGDDATSGKGGKGGKSGASGKGGTGASGDAGDGTGGTGATGGKGGKGGSSGKGGKGGTGGTTGGAGGITGGTGGEMGGMGGTAGAPMCTRLLTFDISVQSAGYSYSNPGWLTSSSGLYWDEEGNPLGGSVRMVVPFSAEDQSVGLSMYRYILNLTGWTIVVRAKLRSGLTADAGHPGNVRLVAKSGFNEVYASGPVVDLVSDEWVTLRLDPGRPDYVDESLAIFNQADVRDIALELRSGDDPDTTYTGAELLVDDLSVCQLPDGSGGAGGSGGRGGAGAGGMGGTSAGTSGAGFGGDVSLGGMGGEGGA